MKIGDYLVKLERASKNTIWWHNLNTKANTREDHLVSLTRIYSRDDKAYFHRLIIGRWSLAIADFYQ